MEGATVVLIILAGMVVVAFAVGVFTGRELYRPRWTEQDQQDLIDLMEDWENSE